MTDCGTISEDRHYQCRFPAAHVGQHSFEREKPVPRVVIDGKLFVERDGLVGLLNEVALDLELKRDFEDTAPTAVRAVTANLQAFKATELEEPKKLGERMLQCARCSATVALPIIDDPEWGQIIDIQSAHLQDWTFTSDTGWVCPDHNKEQHR
jgi:hypothetical protein